MFFSRSFKTIFIALTLISIASSLYLECTYSVRSFWTVPNIYTCTARIISVGDHRNVTDVSRNHLDGRSNSDVKGLSFRTLESKVLPLNIHEFFPNIESIDAKNTLEELSREELSVFPKLKELLLNDNKVQVINSNLFAGNPNMTSISFIRNPVRNVAAGVFDHLSQLTKLHFDGVTCHSQAAVNRDDVLNLIAKIIVQCPPTFDMNFEMIEERLLNGLMFHKKMDEHVSELINPLTYSVFQVNKRLDEVDEQIKKLEREIQNLTLVKQFLQNQQGKY